MQRSSLSPEENNRMFEVLEAWYGVKPIEITSNQKHPDIITVVLNEKRTIEKISYSMIEGLVLGVYNETVVDGLKTYHDKLFTDMSVGGKNSRLFQPVTPKIQAIDEILAILRKTATLKLSDDLKTSNVELAAQRINALRKALAESKDDKLDILGKSRDGWILWFVKGLRWLVGSGCHALFERGYYDSSKVEGKQVAENIREKIHLPPRK